MENVKKSAGYKNSADGFAVTVDEKTALTPLGNPLMVPSERLAEAIAEEWKRQGNVSKGKLTKAAMPLAMIASAAIDIFADPQKRLVHTGDLLGYAQTDLVCYRAGNIPDLSEKQAQLLNPILAWTSHRYAITLEITDGLMPLSPLPDNTAKLAHALGQYDAWTLSALHAATKPLGSLLLALSLIERSITAEEAFSLSTLEEAYETQAWGPDEEKEQKMQALLNEIKAVGRFLGLLSPSP